MLFFKALARAVPKVVKKSCCMSTKPVVYDKAATIACLNDMVGKIRVYDEIDLLAAHLDWHYLLDKRNIEQINANVRNRNANCDIRSLVIAST